MRTLCYVLTLLILAGCAGRQPAPLSGAAQYKAAEGAFQDKLEAAKGLTLTQLRGAWGQVKQGITRNRSTIYTWVQNVSVTAPPEAVAELDLKVPASQNLTLSCMAIFIVDRGVVGETFREGRCLDPTLMPDWQPVIKK